MTTRMPQVRRRRRRGEGCTGLPSPEGMGAQTLETALLVSSVNHGDTGSEAGQSPHHSWGLPAAGGPGVRGRSPQGLGPLGSYPNLPQESLRSGVQLLPPPSPPLLGVPPPPRDPRGFSQLPWLEKGNFLLSPPPHPPTTALPPRSILKGHLSPGSADTSPPRRPQAFKDRHLLNGAWIQESRTVFNSSEQPDMLRCKRLES